MFFFQKEFTKIKKPVLFKYLKQQNNLKEIRLKKIWKSIFFSFNLHEISFLY